MSKAVETLEYSVNDSEWKELGTNTVNFGGTYGDLRLRGKSSIGTSAYASGGSIIKFGNLTPVDCSGDIRTLVDYENYDTTDTSNARFCSLFYNCTNLTTPPELPATKLNYYCYDSMFYNCTSLEIAPSLPATTLARSCYDRMFYKCKSLVIAPKLPAIELADLCYSHMFYGCENLIEAPQLPASNLASGCYNQMFNSCINLTTAPVLSATSLVEDCYNSMFANCTNLITAPKLPASNLAERCYVRIFENCSKLNAITMLATNISANNCLLDWVSGISPTGTFTKSKDMESLSIGTSGIPEGWTIKNYEDDNTFKNNDI